MRKPAYLELYQKGELLDRAVQAVESLRECRLCPRRCGVNRPAGEMGFCRTGRKARVASYHAHFGEEAPLVGSGGSGTIFISSCNLCCTFCQNYETSHLMEGMEVTPEQLAGMMLQLAGQGCHNINFVTPSHVVPQILEALILAAERGLTVPLVYNSGGYDSVSTLKLLEGVFDIYMPDFKFWDSRWANRYCAAPDYRDCATAAIKEMHRQVGDLQIDRRGIAVRGLLVRHLVMPNGVAGTREILGFLANEVSRHTYVNVMAQYHPCGKAHTDENTQRGLTLMEYQEALEFAAEAGLTRLDK
jgi:putative pyruvate formate lyase activating enzyme